MANTDEKVMQLVEAELTKDPDAELKDLYEKAKKSEKSIGKLSLRQFNARYPLQVKRRRAQKSGGRKRGRKTGRRTRRKAAAPGNGREGVRKVFLGFATDIAGAQERKDLVKVLADVDKYVDQAMKAAGK